LRCSGVGFAGNFAAAVVRSRAGRRLGSPALVADGNHARADAYVSLTWHSWLTVRGHHHPH